MSIQTVSSSSWTLPRGELLNSGSPEALLRLLLRRYATFRKPVVYYVRLAISFTASLHVLNITPSSDQVDKNNGCHCAARLHAKFYNFHMAVPLVLVSRVALGSM